jgi:hypothetical protein
MAWGILGLPLGCVRLEGGSSAPPQPFGLNAANIAHKLKARRRPSKKTRPQPALAQVATLKHSWVGDPKEDGATKVRIGRTIVD